METSRKFSGAGDGTRTREMKAWEAFALPLGHARMTQKSSTVAAIAPVSSRQIPQAYTQNPEKEDQRFANAVHAYTTERRSSWLPIDNGQKCSKSTNSRTSVPVWRSARHSRTA